MTSRLIPRPALITGGMPVTISRRHRTTLSGPCPCGGAPGLAAPPPPPIYAPSWVGRSPPVSRGRSVVSSCVEGPGGPGLLPRGYMRSMAVGCFFRRGGVWVPSTEG